MEQKYIKNKKKKRNLAPLRKKEISLTPAIIVLNAAIAVIIILLCVFIYRYMNAPLFT